MAYQRNRISKSTLDKNLQAILEIPVVIDRESVYPACVSKITGLADKHGLTIYDASYLELSTRLFCPLATLDQRLLQAAENEGVAYLP